jgi:hypothetical protein
MRFSTIAAVVVCAINASVVSGFDGKDSSKAGGKALATSSITVTGCLERDDAMYRLTETGGSQAPQSRSWKTGFLKKRNTNLDIVDASRKLKLKDHVGHRVAMTGQVQDGEMRAQSMRHLAASCGH